MNPFSDPSLGLGTTVLLFACLAIALGFEFVNGFHDTANAVATVIYTNSLKPRVAVLISGLMNFTGVFVGGIGVAMGIIKLLPVELLVSSGPGAGLAMVLALLLSAILWNLGTWYLGLPASSSHTLIGAILGVGLASSLSAGRHFGDGVNWSKAIEVGLSLLISPIIGFTLAYVMLLIIKSLNKSGSLLQEPLKGTPPPRGIRALLVATCSGVSFAHGSNDGQKGVGIVMLILMGLVPAAYSINLSGTHQQITTTVDAADRIEATIARHSDAAGQQAALDAKKQLDLLKSHFVGRATPADVPRDERFPIREEILLADKAIDALEKTGALGLSSEESAQLKKDRGALRTLVEYAPSWVLVAIALSLGIGTMIGWKRIVVTLGEKIGKTHLTYGQGASAELVAMSTIGLSAFLGLPVSTTHVLSSGIAGTMVAQKSGLQGGTVRSIALAWVFTLPASMTLAAGLFLVFKLLVPTPATPPGQPPPGAPPTWPIEEIRLAGSNTIGSSLGPRLAQAFLESRGAKDVVVSPMDRKEERCAVEGTIDGKHVKVSIHAPGSAAAFEELASGACDVGMASRPIKDEEITKLATLGDMTSPDADHVLGVDGIAVVVNRSNKVTKVTTKDLASIFKGEITDWSSLGGAKHAIHVLVRDERSGTYDAFASAVLGGDKVTAPGAKTFDDNAALSTAVAHDEDAIGFVGLPYVRDARALAIDDGDARPLYPTVFTVATEDYPLSRRLRLYTAEHPKSPLARDLVEFALSDAGQKIVEDAGFVSLGVRAESAEVAENTPIAYVKQTEKGQRLSLDFRFKPGGVALDTRGARDLERVVGFLSKPENRTKHVTLLGFTDNQGKENDNQLISQRRADAVATELKARGITAESVTGMGSSMPVASNRSVSGRDRNRRVEVWIR